MLGASRLTKLVCLKVGLDAVLGVSLSCLGVVFVFVVVEQRHIFAYGVRSFVFVFLKISLVVGGSVSVFDVDSDAFVTVAVVFVSMTPFPGEGSVFGFVVVAFLACLYLFGLTDVTLSVFGGALNFCVAVAVFVSVFVAVLG